MSAEERRRLHDERRLLAASLDDVAAEHAAGELDDDAFREIVERDHRRLADVDAALASLDHREAAVAEVKTDPVEDGHDPAAPRRRRWVLLAVGAVAIFLAVGAIVVHRGTQTSTISAAEVRVLLAQADTLAQKGKVSEALALYSQVLAADATQPEALAQSGFLTFEAGLSAASAQLTARGEAQVRQAVALAPKDYAPRLYLGVIELLGNADPGAALTQFAAFTALDPPAKWVTKAQLYIDKAKADLSTTATTPTG